MAETAAQIIDLAAKRAERSQAAARLVPQVQVVWLPMVVMMPMAIPTMRRPADQHAG